MYSSREVGTQLSYCCFEAVRDDHYTIDDELVDEVMLAYTVPETKRRT